MTTTDTTERPALGFVYSLSRANWDECPDPPPGAPVRVRGRTLFHGDDIVQLLRLDYGAYVLWGFKCTSRTGMQKRAKHLLQRGCYLSNPHAFTIRGPVPFRKVQVHRVR